MKNWGLFLLRFWKAGLNNETETYIKIFSQNQTFARLARLASVSQLQLMVTRAGPKECHIYMRGGRKLEKLLIQCITEHQDSAYRLAYSYVRNKEDALDIVQDAIHKAFISMEKLKQTGSLKAGFSELL